MNTWIIEALDPLLFGDGKPFSAVPGSRARSLPLPTPAPIAGSMRTRHGSDEHGRFDRARVDEVLGLAIHGPIFALQSSAGVHRDWLFPAPADALPLPGPGGPRG